MKTIVVLALSCLGMAVVGGLAVGGNRNRIMIWVRPGKIKDKGDPGRFLRSREKMEAQEQKKQSQCLESPDLPEPSELVANHVVEILSRMNCGSLNDVAIQRAMAR